ncbi:MAG: tRNA pseudouridine(55) synthase TruB [Pseudomonadota bacterium]
MARGRKGRPVHGWLVVDKPAGPSSAGVVAMAKRAYQAQKAGHAGTLDPLATGLLAIAFGEATKTVPYVTDAQKCYHFTVRWGVATETDDVEGAVTETRAARPDAAAIRAALPQFCGDIMQVPPKISAVKVAGARAYDLARSGEDFALAARPLHVARLTLLDCPDADHACFDLVCGKGGYVRSIARDLALALGTIGHISALRRVWAGPFDVTAAPPFALLDCAPGMAAADLLLPVSAGLHSLPELPCSEEAAARLRNGNPAPVHTARLAYGDTAWVAHAGRPLAIGQYRGGLLHPSKVFNFG